MSCMLDMLQKPEYVIPGIRLLRPTKGTQ
uniref:Uncharacterized protein n=1 Tax=Rhizophora mucronata TaxID=61149 RepID=A0A2P2P878_RHIMU